MYYDQKVNMHYGKVDLGTTILDALRASGKDSNHLHLDDLEPIDQLHIRGKAATLDLLRRVPLSAGMNVLDVGGGMGGTARLFAASRGCHVTVLDLTAEYCRVGEMLTKRTGLSDLILFKHGNALDLPFSHDAFDAIWTQHASLNIADKARFYQEISRVLKPGGHFTFFDIVAGPVQPVHFPVPWATDSALSFLIYPETLRELLVNTKFKEVSWRDCSAEALNWFRDASQGKSSSTLGPQILFGSTFKEMFLNVFANLNEERILVIEGVFERGT
ncbi:class I SAM-dependent methyltransferase [Paenibacillus piri]|uniref:Class I SAM-dependent methyltransferase n=1 Tax=Paenibacillus piri TaxID=2547395 RepID=A0A4R5K9P6_9BACL|nr:class I SAM-dependent methyltransferase [Paenibacillus piri]TDF91315.1 class I SAM-dependent methyltransferase [Paenibacillus piri]